MNYLKVFGGDLPHTMRENSIQDTRLYWSKLRAHEGAYKHNKTEGDCIKYQINCKYKQRQKKRGEGSKCVELILIRLVYRRSNYIKTVLINARFIFHF